MTFLLVAMCVVVGGFELYIGRRQKAQSNRFVRRIEDLKEQVSKQNGVLASVGERLTAELSRVKQDVLPGMDSRLHRHAGQIEQLSTLVQQADDYLRAQTARLHDLEKQKITLAALRRKLVDLESSMRPFGRAGADGEAEGGIQAALTRLTDLEDSGGQIMRVQRDLTRTLEDVEDVVSALLRFTAGELDDEVAAGLRSDPGATITAAGRLWCRDDDLRDVLSDVYERCVQAHRLAIRLRTIDGEPDRLRYFLTADSLEDLAGGFAAGLISTGMDTAPASGRRPPEDEATLKAMLRTLYECGGATAQIGPMVMVRTREELLCGVLTPPQALEFENDGLIWDPVSTAVRLRRLPAHQIWDLTAWAQSPAADPPV